MKRRSGRPYFCPVAIKGSLCYCVTVPRESCCTASCESCHYFCENWHYLLWKFSLFLAKVVRSKRWHWVNRVSEQVSVGYVPREFQVFFVILPENLVFNICVIEVISRCFIPTRNDLRLGFLVSPNARGQKISCSNVNGKKVRLCLLLCLVGSKDSTCNCVTVPCESCQYSIGKLLLFCVEVVTVPFLSCHCLFWELSLFLGNVVRGKRWQGQWRVCRCVLDLSSENSR